MQGRETGTLRTVGIWVFGLLAGALFGALMGARLDREGGGLFGLLGGAFAFACARLWLARPRYGQGPDRSS